MKKRFIVYTLPLIIGILFLRGTGIAAEGEKKEGTLLHKIVTITTLDGVRPTTVNSPPGTTVIWVNHSQSTVEILFLEEKITPACGSPVNFFVGKDGAYESGIIPLGGTASLCFTRKGKYNYRVKSSLTFYPNIDHDEYQAVIWIK